MNADTRSRRIFVIAGELTGDMHAANMIRALKARDPNLRFAGLGGSNMKEAGVDLSENIVEDLAIVGLVGILRHFPDLRRLFREVERRFDEDRPDAVLLIDYPGFNLRVARKAKDRGIPVIYYICPQTWAWHESRAAKFPELLDKMLTIFPFEETLFREYGADATFVGHPLLDLMKITMTKTEVCEHFGVDPRRPIISLLPGSRTTEVKSLMPIMLDAAERVQEALPETQFVLPRATTIPRDLIDSLLEGRSVDLVLANEYRYNLRAAADFCWVASGTATLETALLGVPMVIIYNSSWLTWMIAKRLIKLPYIGLANVVAGERIVPELLQSEATGQNLAERTLRMLTNAAELENTRYQLQRVRRRIEFPDGEDPGQAPLGPYDRAAREFLKALDQLCPA
jgi:lipid-A-disaccharide synthase